MAFASQKVLWSVPQTILYICLTVSCGFLGKWLLLQKRFSGGFRQLFFKLLCTSSLEGSANCALHLPPSVLVGSKLRELFSPIQIQSEENNPSCHCCWGILWAYLWIVRRWVWGISSPVLVEVTWVPVWNVVAIIGLLPNHLVGVAPSPLISLAIHGGSEYRYPIATWDSCSLAAIGRYIAVCCYPELYSRSCDWGENRASLPTTNQKHEDFVDAYFRKHEVMKISNAWSWMTLIFNDLKKLNIRSNLQWQSLCVPI